MKMLIEFKLSLSAMLGEDPTPNDLNAIINAPVTYNGVEVGILTGYDIKHDYIYGVYFYRDDYDDVFNLSNQTSFSIEMKGRPIVLAEALNTSLIKEELK